jgi:adenylate cyclase
MSERAVIPFGSRLLKGYDEELPVFGIFFDERPHATSSGDQHA